ncbi:MAG: hypothetical protein ACR2FH_06090 [Caulobacteraceae bacterium]
MNRKSAAIGIALATIGASASATGALAQQRRAAASPPTEPSAVSEIVVTAERRVENVQDVPITVTVVSQDQLTRANVLTTTDLVRTVPSLSASDEGIFQIRSIGTRVSAARRSSRFRSCSTASCWAAR